MSDIYFDFSAVNNGDGTTAAQAGAPGGVGSYNTTDGVSPTEKDIWWVRRSGTQVTIATSIAPVNNFAICGWPVNGDENYADRPASGTANGWDGDTGEEYGEIYKLHSLLYYVSTTVVLNGFYTSRMHYQGNSSISCVNMDGKLRGARFYKCKIENLSATPQYFAAEINGNNNHISDCIFGGGASTASWTSFYQMDNSVVENCTFSFGISMNYAYNNIFTNCDSTLLVDARPYIALDASYAQNCRIENMTADTSAYTGGLTNALITIAGSYNLNVDMTVKGEYSTIIVTGIRNTTTLVPATSADTIAFTTANTTATDSSITMENFEGDSLTSAAVNTVLFLKNCVIPDNNFSITTLFYNSAIYSLNHGGVQGYWKAFNNKGIIESSDVYRTGGSPHSLRCMLETANNDSATFPTLGNRSRGEVIYLDLLAGTHTITMYGAHRLFADALTKGELFLEVDWLDSNGILKSVSSVRQGDLETDASVWVGDTDLTVFKMTQTITIPTDQQVPVRVYGTYVYENSAYLYLDPIPVVT